MGATISKTFKNTSKKIRSTAGSFFRPSYRANSFWASRRVKNAYNRTHSLNNAPRSKLSIKNPNRSSSLTLRQHRRRTTRKN